MSKFWLLYMLDIKIKPRRFLPQCFEVTQWRDIEPYAQRLLDYPITTRQEFNDFLLDQSEFDSVMNEEQAWRYVRNSTHTDNEDAKQKYEMYLSEISQPLQELGNALNQKILASPFVDDPCNDVERLIFKRLKQHASMFRSNNVALQVEISKLAAESNQIRGAMVIELDGEKLTMPQANGRLLQPNRQKRENAWRAIQSRRLQDTERQDEIFEVMIKKRHQIALNAGYQNFRDYAFDDYQRFDYTPDDCFSFYASVEKNIVPILTILNEKRAKRMGLEKLRPWDGSNDPLGRPALKAFNTVEEMTEKSITVLHAIDPMFGDVVRAQRDAGRLDLASRLHKRPGGYNYPMRESVIPFMFANATDKVADINTLIHEAGHATHDILSQHLPLGAHKDYPMEVAELASMTMELFAFDQWSTFFDKIEEKSRAQEDILTHILYILPWIAQVDLFQHEIYLHPEWNILQRHEAWEKISERFRPDYIDRMGLEKELRGSWHNVTHIYSTPFYMIEYAIAQLGALQLWRNYMNDPIKTIAQYKAALSLGSTRPLPDLYATAGIEFDFSEKTIVRLMPFLLEQLAQYDTLDTTH